MNSSSVSAPLADSAVNQVEVSPVRDRPFQDGPLSLDDLQSFDELLNSGVCTSHVALSLAGVKSLESRRISWLLAVHERFCEEGGKLVVHSVWPLLMDALRFLRLDQVLHVADNEAAARRLSDESEPLAAHRSARVS